MGEPSNKPHHKPWNKGKLVGQKAPFKRKEIWAEKQQGKTGNLAKQLVQIDAVILDELASGMSS